MSQSRTRWIGMDVPKASLAVAYVAPTPGAEVTSVGAMGPRPWDMDPRLRKRPSKATPLLFDVAILYRTHGDKSNRYP